MPIYISKGGGGGGADADAIHDNVAGEIAAIAEKTAPVTADLVLIEDSAAANAKKRVQLDNLPVKDISVLVDISTGGAISIENNTYTTVTFDTEKFDTDTCWEGVTNPTRLTATTAGKYLVFASTQWASNAAGTRQVYMRRNDGLSDWNQGEGTAALQAYGSVGGIISLAAAAYVECKVYQTSGGALNLDACRFGMIKIGDL